MAAKASQSSFVELPDAVITEELLKNRTKPNTEVRILEKAILTPTARDYIKIHRITLHRNPAGSKSKDSSHGMSRGTLIAAHLPEVAQALVAEVRKHWNSFWTVEMEAGLLEVVAKAQSVICRGESQQTLVFAKTPHQVACLVNRNVECRAAVVRNAADVRQVREEMGASVLCVDLQNPTYIGLRGILKSSMETSGLIQSGEGRPA